MKRIDHKSISPAPRPVSNIRCPFCGSDDTRREARFGTTHAYEQFYCDSCHTPFEWIKWEENPANEDLPDFLA